MEKKLITLSNRAIAVTFLTKIKNNQTTLNQFDQFISRYQITLKDRSFIWQLCIYGTRYYHYYEKLASNFIQLNKTKDILLILIILGLLQLDHFNQPDYAMISETVNAAKALKLNWAVKLVNAVLRRYQKNKDLKNKLTDAEKVSLPNWLYQTLLNDYPTNQAQSLGQQLLEEADLYLRVNQTKQTTLSYTEHLKSHGISFETITNFPYALKINRNINIQSLPFYQEGYFSVQDLSAQCIIDALPIKPHDKVLDACAAPGGKTAFLLETYPEINLTALDCDERRLIRLNENIERLHLTRPTFNTICADATVLDTWQEHTQFDCIVLDAPCSASGVIRRHPDIKMLRSPNQIKEIVILQQKLLQTLWSLLKPNGYLLYITCSLLQDENDKQIAQFIKTKTGSNAKICQLTLKLPGIKVQYGYQILPEISDGFYYSLLQKIN